MHILDGISVLAEVGTAIGTLILAWLGWKAKKSLVDLEAGQITTRSGLTATLTITRKGQDGDTKQEEAKTKN